MNKINLKYIVLTILLTIVSTCVIVAQNVKDTSGIVMKNDSPQTGTGLFYESGKIYVVVTVMLTIFATIIFYLIRLEKKISSLEKS